jgi:hypothetical protein
VQVDGNWLDPKIAELTVTTGGDAFDMPVIVPYDGPEARAYAVIV